MTWSKAYVVASLALTCAAPLRAQQTPANGSGGIVYRIAPVPEPGTLVLLALGALSVLGWVRRRQRA